MINKLFISNYAIIDNLEIDFLQGLTTITGETGAGKSIILGALNLLLGNRFASINYKDKSTKSIIVTHISRHKFNCFSDSSHNFFLKFCSLVNNLHTH